MISVQAIVSPSIRRRTDESQADEITTKLCGGKRAIDSKLTTVGKDECAIPVFSDSSESWQIAFVNLTNISELWIDHLCATRLGDLAKQHIGLRRWDPVALF